MKFVNSKNFTENIFSIKNNFPFDHCVIDDFFLPNVANDLESEFLDYDDARWFYYKNAIEDKKALNDWNAFPSLTYKVFQELMSHDFISVLKEVMGVEIYVDHGLHGGGWHIHGAGGNLNPHLDYSIHPKMNKLRKLNIIMYLSKNLHDEHGGHLGLWTHDSKLNSIGKLVKEIQPKFNRAVIFDTTQNSWHGMSRHLIQPEGVYRKSLAIYYLTDPPGNADQRERAMFAPRDDQVGDSEIEKLIKLRSDSKLYHTVYKK